MTTSSIRLKRAYDEPANSDGMRVLVDRVWPRGVSKEKAALDEWVKSVAPSTELRKWFGHDPNKWNEFRRRYLAELEDAEHADGVARLQELHEAGRLTLIYAARDTAHNQAVVLKNVLENR